MNRENDIHFRRRLKHSARVLILSSESVWQLRSDWQVVPIDKPRHRMLLLLLLPLSNSRGILYYTLNHQATAVTGREQVCEAYEQSFKEGLSESPELCVCTMGTGHRIYIRHGTHIIPRFCGRIRSLAVGLC